MKIKLTTLYSGGMTLLVVALFAACDKQGDPPANVSSDQAPAPAQAPMKILPPPAALETVALQGGTEECEHEASEHLCFVCNSALRNPNHLWCEEHGRYEERCFICHPDVQDKSRLYCKEHNLYEDECYLCHPEIVPAAKPSAQTGGAKKNSNAAIPATGKRDPSRLWCEEHEIYEDECLICHPDLAEAGSGASSGVLMCKEHSVPEGECGICHPELLAKNTLKVRFGSREAAAKAGVETEQAIRGRLADTVEVYAELSFNQNQLTEIALPVAGIVKSVNVDLGAIVEEGAVLATVSSVEISGAVGEYLRSLAEEEMRKKAFDREQKLSSEKISSQQEVDEAFGAHRAAEVARKQAYQQLLTLGFDQSQIERLPNQDDAVVLEVRAPFSGEIVERDAVRGAWLESGSSLFTVTDTSTLWAILTIPESELRRIEVGQKVELIVESMPGEVFSGNLTWIASQIDDRSRTVRARAEFPNPDGKLKAHMFAQAHIINRESDDLLLIPESAVQRVEGHEVAFVQMEDDLFDVRLLLTGARSGGQIEILGGILPGEEVVTSSSFTVKSQFLLSRLGAGCVDD